MRLTQFIDNVRGYAHMNGRTGRDYSHMVRAAIDLYVATVLRNSPSLDPTAVREQALTIAKREYRGYAEDASELPF